MNTGLEPRLREEISQLREEVQRLRAEVSRREKTDLKEEKTDLKEELYLQIFSYLSVIDLVKVSHTCKFWRVIASNDFLWRNIDLKKIFPFLTIINSYRDEKDEILNENVNLRLDKLHSIVFLKKFYSSLTDKKGNLKIEDGAGVTLLTLYQDMTLNRFIELGLKNSISFAEICPTLIGKYGDVIVEKTYKVALTNSVLKGTRNKSFEEQEAILKKKDCEVPELVPMVALDILTYLSQPGTRLYKKSTYTHCKENIPVFGEIYQTVVGDFTQPRSKSKTPVNPILRISRSGLTMETIGIGAMKKLPAFE